MIKSRPHKHTASLSVLLLMLLSASAVLLRGQAVTTARSELFGIKFQPAVLRIVKEIEMKTGKTVYAEFRELDDYQLGVSFIADEDGRAVVLVSPSVASDRKKVEAVVVHELLHLRLRVQGYPSYIFSSSVKTAKGRAIDVEQGTINDLRSMIEHEVFKAEMAAFGLSNYIDLAGDTLKGAKARRGQTDGQVDSINYARAVLEYLNPSDVQALKKVYQANGWKRALTDGDAIAVLIKRSPITTPAGAEAVFKACIAKLYPPPSRTVRFTLTNDPSNKYFRQLVINLRRS